MRDEQPAVVHRGELVPADGLGLVQLARARRGRPRRPARRAARTSRAGSGGCGGSGKRRRWCVQTCIQREQLLRHGPTSSYDRHHRRWSPAPPPGIGAELARELAAARATTSCWSPAARSGCEELAEELRLAHGIHADVEPCDLADADARARRWSSGCAAASARSSGSATTPGSAPSGRCCESDLEREQRARARSTSRRCTTSPARSCDRMVERGRGRDPQRRLDRGVPAAARLRDLRREQGVRAVVLRGGARRAGRHRRDASPALCPGFTHTEFGEHAGAAEQERGDARSSSSATPRTWRAPASTRWSRAGAPRSRACATARSHARRPDGAALAAAAARAAGHARPSLGGRGLRAGGVEQLAGDAVGRAGRRRRAAGARAARGGSTAARRAPTSRRCRRGRRSARAPRGRTPCRRRAGTRTPRAGTRPACPGPPSRRST